MKLSALTAIATLGVLALGSTASADEQSAMDQAQRNPERAFALRFQLSADVRGACSIDTNQAMISMRTWQRQHECLRDYFNGTLR